MASSQFNPVYVYKTIKPEWLKSAIEEIFLPEDAELIYPALMEYIFELNANSENNFADNRLLERLCYCLVSEQGKYLVNYERISGLICLLEGSIDPDLQIFSMIGSLEDRAEKTIEIILGFLICFFSGGAITQCLVSSGFIAATAMAPVGGMIVLGLGLLSMVISYAVKSLFSHLHEQGLNKEPLNEKLCSLVKKAIEKKDDEQHERSGETFLNNSYVEEAVVPGAGPAPRGRSLFYSRRGSSLITFFYSSSDREDSKSMDSESGPTPCVMK